MQLLRSCSVLCALASAALPALAASSWGFSDATVAVQGKGAGGAASLKEPIPQDKPVHKPIALRSSDTLKVTLTTHDGAGTAGKRPHQAFLLLRSPATGLDISYPFSVKENGKARIELTQKDLPVQFLGAKEPLDASFVFGSFGSIPAYNGPAFRLSAVGDPGEPLPSSALPARYAKLPEIHHIFKPDAKSPALAVTLLFAVLVLALLPALGALWLVLGANINHLPAAFRSAPIPHAVFLASLFALEAIFYMYYTAWNLFQTLPAALAVGAVAFLSGSRALGEVQARRLAGLR